MYEQGIVNQDNVVEQKDSIQLSNNPIIKDQEFEEGKKNSLDHCSSIPIP